MPHATPRRRTAPHAHLSIYIPVDLIVQIGEAADAAGTSRHQLVRTLIQIGFASYRANQLLERGQP